MSEIRGDRRSEELKKCVSEVIRDMKDPRISEMTTVTAVEMTKDLKYAKLRVSVYDPDDAVRKKTIDALNHAAGFIAHEAGQRMQIRRVPQMTFLLDHSIEYSVHISQLIEQLHQEEK